MSSLLRALSCVSRSVTTNSFRIAASRPSAFGQTSSSFRPLSTAVQAQQVSDPRTRRINKRLRDLSNEYESTLRISRRVPKSWLKEALPIFKREGLVGGSHVHMLLRATGSFAKDLTPAERDELTNKIWKVVNKDEIDISHYNTLLQVKLDNGANFDPLAILQEITHAGFTPNRVTYQRLIQRYCEMGDVNGASKIIEYMKSEGIAVPVQVFHSLIEGHLRKEDIAGAHKIIDVMKSSDLLITTDTHVAMATGLLRLNETTQALEIIQDKPLNQTQVLTLYKEAALNDQEKTGAEILKFLKGPGLSRTEFTNMITELMTLGKQSAALSLFDCMRQWTPSDGNFIVAQMVRSDAPLEKVVNLCNRFKEEGINGSGLLVAARVAVNEKSSQVGLEYLQALKNEGFKLKQHYFYPLICASKNENELLKSIKQVLDCGIPIADETLSSFIMPRIETTNSGELASKLTSIGIRSGLSSALVARSIILKGELQKALDFVSQGGKDIESQSLLIALSRKTKPETLEKCIAILSELSKKKARSMNPDVVTKYLTSVKPLELKQNAAKMIAAAGLPVDKQNLAILREAGLDDTLFAANAFEIVEQQRPASVRTFDMSVEELQAKVAEPGGEQAPLGPYLNTLVKRLSQDGKLAEAEALVKKHGIGELDLASLGSLMLEHLKTGNIEKALEYKSKILAYPDVVLKQSTALSSARLFAEKDMLQEAKDLLAISDQQEFSSTKNLLNQLVEAVATKFGAKKALELTDEVRAITALNAASVGKFIRSGPFDQALEFFVGILEEHGIFVSRQVILNRAIKEGKPEQANALIKLLLKKTRGPFVYYEIASAYHENGHLDEAKTYLNQVFLDDEDLGVFQSKFNYLLKAGLFEQLESATKLASGHPSLAKTALDYKILLLVRQSNADGALKVWTDAQELDVTPSDSVMAELSHLLRENGFEVPFVINATQLQNQSLNFEKFDQLVTEGKLEEAARALDGIDWKNFDALTTEFKKSFLIFIRALEAANDLKILEALQKTHGGSNVERAIANVYHNTGRAEEYMSKFVENSEIDLVYPVVVHFLNRNQQFLKRAEENHADLKTEKDMKIISAVWNVRLITAQWDDCKAMLHKFPSLKENSNIVLYASKLESDPEFNKNLIAIAKETSPKTAVKILDLVSRSLFFSMRIIDAHDFLKQAHENGLTVRPGLYRALERKMASQGQKMQFEIPDPENASTS